jgi:hypothetical protein
MARLTDFHRQQPHLFIGGETQRSKILNLTVKRSGSRAFGGNSSEALGNRRLGRRFLPPRFLILGFRWLRFASKQALHHQGASIGVIRNQAFRIPKIKECFQLLEFLCERPSSETTGVLESIFISQNTSFDQYPSLPAEPPN